MSEFPHLRLPIKIPAKHKSPRRPFNKTVSKQTLDNLINRRQHGRILRNSVDQITNDWYSQIAAREEELLPAIPNASTIPIFLKIDSNEFDAEQLYSFGIEVIAEEDGGFIIGASSDNFRSLKNKIAEFIKNDGKFKNTAAKLWNIIHGNQWRIDYILSEELKTKWDTIEVDEVLLVDISVACYVKISGAPSKKQTETDNNFQRRYENWLNRKEFLEIQRVDLEMQRQDELDAFIIELGGERKSDFVGYEDSFSCRVLFSGKALKDFVINYQYLFDVSEYDDLTFEHPETGAEETIEVGFEVPDDNASRICLIDSGIQEEHRMIRDAIETVNSKSYLSGDDSVADTVPGGGHGTKVAGAILFGNTIPKTGTHKHVLWIQNAKVLDRNGWLPEKLYPPELMNNVINDYQDTKIFNLSINSKRPCKTVHMSEWAATIDSISHNRDKLFIISTGNINPFNVTASNPGIIQHLMKGRDYPEYLLEDASRIANPAQSCFALTVGSVANTKYNDEDKESFTEKDEPSSLTRTGPGIWKMIKPDVVEYGGDYIKEKNQNPLISTLPVTSAEVIKTTFDGSNAIGYDVGTSYAAPKVSHIAGAILNEIPSASANLIRTLIVQSARLPEDKFRNPSIENIRMYGYGIPSKIRATQNFAQRITLTAESTIAAKEAEIYTIMIPKELNRPGDEYDILIEITLAFTSKTRRTRRQTKSYLSTWLDWQSSKFGENYNQFKARISQFSDGDEIEEEDDNAENIPWCIRESISWGTVKGLRRQDSSLQKDWLVTKSYNLPAEFSIAVIGHKGWEKDLTEEVPYSIAVSFEVLNAEIDVYNLIRIENEIEIEQRVRI
ncbi:MAG: S8 family peptidase [Bacteroidetes bacterium]|nr:S8 family peptidase [Bacteroidota bacterium]